MKTASVNWIVNFGNNKLFTQLVEILVPLNCLEFKKAISVLGAVNG